MSPADRRKHKRYPLECPVTLLAGNGEVLGQSRTANVSDGGLFVAVPAGRLPPAGVPLSLRLAVPRTTPNTRMLEHVSVEGTVVRYQRLADDRMGMGLEFAKALELMIEV